MIKKTNNRKLAIRFFAIVVLLSFNSACIFAQDFEGCSQNEPTFSVAVFEDPGVSTNLSDETFESIGTIQVVGFTVTDAGISNEYQEESPIEESIELVPQQDSQPSPSDDAGSDDADSQTEEPAEEAEEGAFQKPFPVANLRGGILDNSLQRAVAQGDIVATTIYVDSSPVVAPDQFRYDQIFTWKTWDSPNICYRPLLFEEENVERYGIHCHLQPAVSGVRFLTNVIALPYKKGIHCHRKCVYGLGYYPSGNCNPAYWPHLEKSQGGIAAQALTVGAIISLL